MDVFALAVKNYLVANVALLGAGIAFLLWKKPRKAWRLNMRAGVSPQPSLVPNSLSRLRGAVESPEKALNVFFNYNGHSWDAFEVLGLPAGSSWDHVQNRFGEAVNKADESSRPFLEAALHAIEKHLKSH